VGEDFASTVARMIGEAYGPLAGVAAIVVMAVVLVLLKRAGKIPWPKMPPPSPDLVENPPSPPIVLNPDGSVPTANPRVPPEPLP
jgi:hypothetical protein